MFMDDSHDDIQALVFEHCENMPKHLKKHRDYQRRATSMTTPTPIHGTMVAKVSLDFEAAFDVCGSTELAVTTVT